MDKTSLSHQIAEAGLFKTVVPMKIGMVVMKMSVFRIQVGKAEAAAGEQGVKGMAQSKPGIPGVMQRHGMEYQITAQISGQGRVQRLPEQFRAGTIRQMCQLLPKNIQHSRLGITQDQVVGYVRKTQADQAGPAAKFHGEGTVVKGKMAPELPGNAPGTPDALRGVPARGHILKIAGHRFRYRRSARHR